MSQNKKIQKLTGDTIDRPKPTKFEIEVQNTLKKAQTLGINLHGTYPEIKDAVKKAEKQKTEK